MTKYPEKRTATTEKVSYLQLYRYATKCDKYLMAIGCFLTILAGIANPLMMKLFGDVTEAFVDYAIVKRTTIDEDELKEAGDQFYLEITNVLITNIVLGTLTVLFSYSATILFHYTAQKQILKIRIKYFASMLNQDIAWYDTNHTGDFIIRITEDLAKIQDGIGAKVTVFLFYFSVFIAAIIFALIMGWKLALICMVCCPISVITMGFMTWITARFTKTEIESYSSAGAIAEEVFGAIKTVVAFEGQHKEHDRYKKHLIDAERNNIKRSIFMSMANGFLWLNIYGSVALSFWYGFKLIWNDKLLPAHEMTYTTSVMISICFATFSANWSFGQCSSYFDMFATAQVAAYKVFAAIESIPTINLAKGCGIIPVKVRGDIAFNNVTFEYPSRPNVKIVNGLNLTIKSGETVALVGASGCGKSTCIQLIQRFYDPTSGTITLDGNPINMVDLKWLRSLIGVVGQEPVLFDATVADNIKYGNPNATEIKIEEAAQKANAHSFITSLPDGYNTMVGERGAQLSGGQKQRIAIARALIRRPTILLLDEATSALDINSEAIVQAALDEARKDTTTIIVAHRLSTIKDADRIIVLSEGTVVEDGNHDNLMKLKGQYYNLVMRQLSETKFKTNVVEDEESCDKSPDEINRDFKRVSTYIDSKEQEVEVDGTQEASTMRVLMNVIRLNKPEWFFITLGLIAAFGFGSNEPIYAIFFGSIFAALSNENEEYVRTVIAQNCLYFVYIGLMAGICSFVQHHFFNIAGERLTKRVRSKLFRAILKQEQGWFDDKNNGVGALCTKLSNDAAYIQGASGQPIGVVMNSISSFGLAISFSLAFEWRTTLVTLCFTPLILTAIYLEQRLMNDHSNKNNQPFEESSKVALEAITNIRTVASLGCEHTFMNLYTNKLQEHLQSAKHGAHFHGISLGMARSMIFFTYGVSFFYGGTLVLSDNVNYANAIRVTESLVMSAWSLGAAIAYTPNIYKGIASAKKIFQLINRTSFIKDPVDPRQLDWITGNIHCANITFSYPNRSNAKVLRGIDLCIKHGKTVALVGASGCGKTTFIQLLQRFYDPSTGKISLDAIDIKELTLKSLRANFGIVSQEPVLFDRTIAENIAYGDNDRVVLQPEIIEAAKSANIHNFISNLPQGYDTRVGVKGTQLSGGQKQRIAIARALIRNPKILLLDEATSALDAESEKIVQDALDNAKKNRTCITIAHRLTTIKDADVICVLHNGKIEEMGSHDELLHRKGLYYNLQTLQM